MEMETWAMKGNGFPIYLLCFLMEQLLDISLTSGTIQAEHRILCFAVACPTHSSETRRSWSKEKVSYSPQANSCGAGSASVEDSWFYCTLLWKQEREKTQPLLS